MASAKVEENKVVSIHYTLRDEDGDVIDTSEGEEPLALLYGQGELVAGLERALLGLTVGDKLDVVVPPEDGYGLRTSEGPRSVPLDAFPEGVTVEEGMCFDVEEEEDGELQTFWVSEVREDEVLIDLDHPLAGVTLHFSVEITGVRDATPEEIEHGHAHDGDHHH